MSHSRRKRGFSLVELLVTISVISLLAAVGRLSEPHREVVSRKHFAGQSGDRIARQLGVPPGTVRSRLSRAYAELREMLTEQESDQADRRHGGPHAKTT